MSAAPDVELNYNLLHQVKPEIMYVSWYTYKSCKTKKDITLQRNLFKLNFSIIMKLDLIFNVKSKMAIIYRSIKKLLFKTVF